MGGWQDLPGSSDDLPVRKSLNGPVPTVGEGDGQGHLPAGPGAELEIRRVAAHGVDSGGTWPGS